MNTLSPYILIMRPKQWVKNSFVMAPLLFTGMFNSLSATGAALTATALFCIGSSATYILNDIQDLEHDRRHPVKSKKRPLAAGSISIFAARNLIALLYLILLLALFVLPEVVGIIAAYIVLNFAYTLSLKHQPVVDIFTIAAGFVLRVSAGAVVLEVPVSGWMLVTTLSLALYLAAVKRRQELSLSGAEGRKVLKHYSVTLVERYAEMSATSALLFYSMFVLSDRPELVLTIPLVLFGIFRYWYVVEALDGGESPTDVLLADRPLLITVLLWGFACVFTLWSAGG